MNNGRLGDRPSTSWTRERPPPRRKRHKNQGLASLGELVPRALPRNAPPEAKLARVVALWERSVPHRVATNVTPVRLRGDTIFLHTRSSVWAQEVSLLAPQLLEHVRARAPNLPFKKLAARVGPMPERRPVEEEVPVKVIPLAPEALPDEVKASLTRIADPELRATLTAAACSTLAPRPAKKRA